MILKLRTSSCYIACGAICLMAMAGNVSAQTIPITGPADVGRIKPEEKNYIPDQRPAQVQMPEAMKETTPLPDEFKHTFITLKQVNIEGAHVFSKQEIAEVYAPYINKKISLDIVWKIADEITQKYRDNGYFLSKAYVVPQKIKDGVVTIRVSEGFIGKVELEGPLAENRIVKSYIAGLMEKKPVKDKEVERFLLSINDLPGYSFRGTLTALDGDVNSNGVKLVLTPTKEKGKGAITFDNYGSRYIGPYEGSISYDSSFLPMQETAVTISSSLPTDELRYGTIRHDIALMPDTTLQFEASKTKAYPGYTLQALNIDSDSTYLSTGVDYKIIRQRTENLDVKVSLDGRDVKSDIINSPLTRDNVRAGRVATNYSFDDEWMGYNDTRFVLSQGLDILNSSGRNDLNLSRAAAAPDFTKAEFNYSRLQQVMPDWTVQGAVASQLASKALYSSEEFGYGGQSFGRAYDASEITGDSGVNGLLALNWEKWGYLKPVALTPYVFYDAGVVWNRDQGQKSKQTGTSAGGGVRFSYNKSLSGNLGLAFPLTREASTPIYDTGDKGPRILLQIIDEF